MIWEDKVYIANGQDPEAGLGPGNLYAIDATERGDITTTGRIRRYGEIERSISTVAIYGGLLFAADVNGYLHCLDVNSGKAYWTHDLMAGVWASPMVIDGRVYLGTADGDVIVLRASKEIIEQLSQAEVDDVVQAGDSFRVTLRVLGGTVTHLLKMPSAKDVFDYRRGFARVLDLPYNRQELTINLAAAGGLYKKLVTATEGYAGEAPIIHQAVALKAAIDALDAAFQETSDPN